ncbi:hypothetical protein LEMLEM_LOCUS19495 [Lemmus lemmus]
MCRLEPFLKRSLVVLLFLGLAEACIRREGEVSTHPPSLLGGILGLMSRLSPDGFRQNIISSSKMPPLVTTPGQQPPPLYKLSVVLGLLSLQVLNGDPSRPLSLVKSPPASTTARVLVKNGGWNFWKCAYMVMTFFFVSYNKGDWVRRTLLDGYLSVYGGRRVKGKRGGEERMRREGTVGEGSLQCSQLPCETLY